MQDHILESLFLDVDLWAEVIDHGLSHGIPVSVLEQLADPHVRAEMCRQIEEGEYVIQPPHTGYRPKDDGGERMFLANEPMDRLLLNACYKWLIRNESAMIHPSCLSYQEGIGISHVVRQLSGHMSVLCQTGGNRVIGRKFDIHKYFDTISRQCIHRAFDLVEQHHGRSAIISVLRAYYDSDVYYDTRARVWKESYQGIKQGCAVSSWLANVLLYHLDVSMSGLEGYYVRYSDDIIYVGQDYEQATACLQRQLALLGLSLNQKKIEDVTTDAFVRFLGYGVRGCEITLSRKWVKEFQRNVDRRTIGNRKLISRVRAVRQRGGKQMQSQLTQIVRSAQQSLSRFLYYGDGQHSWASVVLDVINRPADVKCLSLYCLDALRAVYTGKTSIGGLGFDVNKGIVRGKGRHVNANRQSCGWLDGFLSVPSMQKNIRHPWVYRALVVQMISASDYPLYGANASAACRNRTEMLEGLEARYSEYLDSQPTGEQIDRFYARPLSDMDTCDLLVGGSRHQAQKDLEEYLVHEVDFSVLQPDPGAWYWQSERYPQLVLLRSWFA